jgi:hypothetical protein
MPSMEKDPASPPEPAPAAQPKGRRPWTVPHLRVFGTVAAITSSISMKGANKDGGPNNLKT